ncbi:hypothetical protein KQX54_005646 [Cotesia glomerata]|uniref:Uncharacterized protein n=1 Tax=Cotesia glomerata TaxID=32391 RepID=A0AAV7HTZ6_COTGL|nr:hypothetical protein KQX54_005646 [Cotesia glomerata]
MSSSETSAMSDNDEEGTDYIQAEAQDITNNLNGLDKPSDTYLVLKLQEGDYRRSTHTPLVRVISSSQEYESTRDSNQVAPRDRKNRILNHSRALPRETRLPKRYSPRMPVQDETSVRYTHTELSGPSARGGSEFSERPARLLNPDDATRCLSLGVSSPSSIPETHHGSSTPEHSLLFWSPFFGPLHDPKTRF